MLSARTSTSAWAPPSPGCHACLKPPSQGIRGSSARDSSVSEATPAGGAGPSSGTGAGLPTSASVFMQRFQNGVKTRYGEPWSVRISHGSNSNAPLQLSAVRPSSCSPAFTALSRAIVAGSYSRFHVTVCAPVSAIKVRNAVRLGPRRMIRRCPRASRSRCNDTRLWCSHQRLAAPGSHGASSSGAWT